MQKKGISNLDMFNQMMQRDNRNNYRWSPDLQRPAVVWGIPQGAYTMIENGFEVDVCVGTASLGSCSFIVAKHPAYGIFITHCEARTLSFTHRGATILISNLIGGCERHVTITGHHAPDHDGVMRQKFGVNWRNAPNILRLPQGESQACIRFNEAGWNDINKPSLYQGGGAFTNQEAYQRIMEARGLEAYGAALRDYGVWWD